MTKLPGRLWRIDSQGFIMNDASPEQIVPPFSALVDETVQKCTDAIGADIDSLYITGSVARGLAVEGQSDLNVFVVLDAASDPDLVLRDWVPDAEAALRAGHPCVSDVQIELWSYYSIFTDPARFSIGAFILKTHSACVWGVDLNTQLPDYKITPAIANDDLIQLEADLADSVDALERMTSEEAAAAWCRFAAKAGLRAGFGLVQMPAQVHTRDVDLCADYFRKYYPQHTDDARSALRYAIQPTRSAHEALAFVKHLQSWLLPLGDDWLDQYNPDREPDLPVDDVEEME